MEWNLSVQLYLLAVMDFGGIPEKDRPTCCPNCGQTHQLIHRHGQSPPRTVITLIEFHRIPIFRFLCPVMGCQKAFSVIPDFVEKHHQVAVEVKELIITQNEGGTSLADIAEQSGALPGGPYSEKTLWRWTSQWDERLDLCQPDLWKWMVSRLPHFHLLKGQARPDSEWGWFLQLWKQVQAHLPETSKIRFLHFLHRFSRSIAVAVRFANPTK